MNLPPDSLFAPKVMNRRSFLFATATIAAAAAWSDKAHGAVTRKPVFSAYPFQMGVASGDPAPDGVVLWTRLIPKPLEEGGGMSPEPVEVSWQIAEDESMGKIVKKGTVVASAPWAHTVHIEVEGLKPDRWYWYQFKAGDEVSPKGRTRTMPPANSTPDRLRFAFASCQHYETGLFTAYEHMVKEDLDLVLHLGDYIYEYAGIDKRIRKHVGTECKTLEGYRSRYAQYRSDPALQNMHAAAPWIVTWDDHEFDNNCAGAISEEKGVSEADFLIRRAAAYQAYYEHMPLRRSALPKGPDMTLYRRLDFGRLAGFHVLDTRQYRSDQPCGDGNKPQCDEALDPNRTLLGSTQRDWLFNGLSRSSSAWNVLAQQIMIARVDRKAGPEATYSMDQWPGYEGDRRRLLKFLHERKIANPVALAGDIHTNWANELIADFDDLDSKSVATEFVGTSISSSGDGTAAPKTLEQTYSENPFVKFHNAERGYVRCDVTKKEWRTDYRTVEYVSRPGAPLNTRRSFVVESGRPKLQNA
ncbi:MAG TPA: alkaline phosphatase D family protein [Roseimicrobium sp.]|nr:alkaline phosphatase D family protein [Roseimicrobium sp.]